MTSSSLSKETETKSPPSSPSDSIKSNKSLLVNVQFLDDTNQTFQVVAKSCGRVLFEEVCKYLNLLEVDYFGLEYADAKDTKYWLDYEKPMYRQMCMSSETTLNFCVKFYTPDPAQLEEELTRYFFSLQIKKDLANGFLQCNDKTAVVLASYIVQSECGDFCEKDYPDHSYLSSFRFFPQQTPDIEIEIMELHKKHVGQSSTQADQNLLETARRCELYGLRLTPAKDPQGVALNLAVAHMGVLVFQNLTKINTFSWAKIRKLSFKRRRFLIKLHPEGFGYYKDTVEFIFDARNKCKNFWKKCIENHTFFRCTEVKHHSRQKKRIFSRGSSFRYSGRTQKQVVEYIRENFSKRQPFQRSTSLRVSSSQRPHPKSSDPSSPLSAQPVLPVSHSCGSVALCPESPEPRVHERCVSEPASPRMTTLNNGSVSPLAAAPSATVNNHHPEEPSPTSPGQQPEPAEEANKEIIEVRNGEKSTPCLEKIQIIEEPSEQDAVDSVVKEKLSSRLPSEDISSSLQDNDYPQSPLSQKFPQSPLNESHRGHSSEDDDLTTKINTTSPVPATIQELITSSPRISSEELKKRKLPMQRSYFIAKELLMSERTYKKDLEVVNVWFRDEVTKEDSMPMDILNVLFALIDPIYECHCRLLRELEQRLSACLGMCREGKVGELNPLLQGVGDIFLKNIDMLVKYERYIERLPLVLERIQISLGTHPQFEQACRDFELQKVCCLPLTTFILRPALRLQHYAAVVERFLSENDNGELNDAHLPRDKDDNDINSCQELLKRLNDILDCHKVRLDSLVNYVKLMEIQRYIIGVDNLVVSGREFLREGGLLELSKKGFQQRMLILFTDMLLYVSRSSSSSTQVHFKPHGQLPLESLFVEETEPKMGLQHCFSIYGENRTLMLSASSDEVRRKWVTDLIKAITNAKERGYKLVYSSLSSSRCASLKSLEGGPSLDNSGDISNLSEKDHHMKSNNTLHMCWHRNRTISSNDYYLSVTNNLSCYLLRKFKNNNHWQKLWVVFANFCMFFYKSYLDEFPLACLPLLGYTVSSPTIEDNMNKNFVFKLRYKTHTFFFRTESDYIYNRWLQMLKTATQNN